MSGEGAQGVSSLDGHGRPASLSAPRATYRIQFRPEFGFADAAGLVGYLRDLGVSHLYASPLLQAAPGSAHGYDVLDHLTVNEELGGEDGFDALRARLTDVGLSMVVDIVPNHMAIATPGNRWWMDVLQNGRASRYADYFDIDWSPPEAKLADKILVPVLGDHYGRVLEGGELQLVREQGSLGVRYYEHVFPLDPTTIADIIEQVSAGAESQALDFLARNLRRLPPTTATDATSRQERQVDGPVLLRLLAECGEDPLVGPLIDEELTRVSSNADLLDDLLSRQNYRLAFWRTSGRELDYRRFFDVDNLVGLRTENPVVFDEIHQRVVGWVADGAIDGVRIDHIDGLRDPFGYLCHLRSVLPGAWTVVEKILEPGEELRTEWPVDGTTGYEFANLVGGLFVDPGGRDALLDHYGEVTGGDMPPFDDLLLEAKLEVMQDMLGAEVNRLTESFVGVCENHRRFRDFSRHELHETIREALASFAVYRTYVAEVGPPAVEDVGVIDRAIEAALKRRPDLDQELFVLLRRILVADPDLNGEPERELRARFQQVSGPVMAKSKEDTAFYRYVPLLSLNEVGGDPNSFGVPVDEFHHACERVQRLWPTTMLTLTTHDTKRTEDVRARLDLLSEIPEQWADAVRRWRRHNAPHRGPRAPDPVTEHYVYQTLVAAHPLPLDRARTHLTKAVREAKTHTSWVQVDEDYERELFAFLDALYDDEDFQRELREFVTPLLAPGRVNALAQKLLQLTAPGVPDLYQGQELWDLSLVDPDNRRPVDFERRRALLADLRAVTAVDETGARSWLGDLEDPADEGAAKLRVLERALATRNRWPDCFGPDATYEPIVPIGPDADHLVSFCRSDRVITAVPRLLLRLRATGSEWEDTELPLPEGRWQDVFDPIRTWTGAVPVGELLAPFPVALLVRDTDEGFGPRQRGAAVDIDLDLRADFGVEQAIDAIGVVTPLPLETALDSTAIESTDRADR